MKEIIVIYYNIYIYINIVFKLLTEINPYFLLFLNKNNYDEDKIELTKKNYLSCTIFSN